QHNTTQHNTTQNKKKKHQTPPSSSIPAKPMPKTKKRNKNLHSLQQYGNKKSTKTEKVILKQSETIIAETIPQNQAITTGVDPEHGRSTKHEGSQTKKLRYGTTKTKNEGSKN
ncbi:MAG: hypothetical protein ACUVXA_10615, partial [Candidatus Jordarchaeum sp.]|uniref:hypothetical protein n=1 Tax=Candidatus Jordarchaeum sp. TaxID=2823881 RepID=UPI00404A1DAA